jgi:hypothetical protein
MYLYFNIFYEGIWWDTQLLIFIHRHLKHKIYTCSLYDCTEKNMHIILTTIIFYFWHRVHYSHYWHTL